MKLSDFLLLSEVEKMKIILHDGVLIGKRFTSDFTIFLFQMNSFYVESYCNMDSKVVEEFRLFTSIDLLCPYLEMISLDNII